MHRLITFGWFLLFAAGPQDDFDPFSVGGAGGDDAGSCVPGEVKLPISLPVADESVVDADSNPQGIQPGVSPDGSDANPDPGDL